MHTLRPAAARALAAAVLALGTTLAPRAAAHAHAARGNAHPATTARATRVADVARLRLEGLAPPYFLPAGRSVRLAVRAFDQRGRPVSVTPRWRVDDAKSATVDGATGVLTARTRGFVRVGATVGDTTAWWTVLVSPRVDSVPLELSRRVPGTGPVVVSSGIPLAPGALRPGEEGRVRLVVDGAEPAVRVAPLAGRHADGSLRAVLVQFRYVPARGGAPDATLLLGAPRRAAAFAAVAPPAVPDAALLPAEPEYLIAADVVGPTVSMRETAFLGSAFRRYDSDFATFADRHWSADGDKWDNNYYDRALIYYVQWARSGRPEYWWRATRHAHAYRRDYLEANNYLSSPHWSQLEGVEKHYLLTGDEASRTAVARTADVIWGAVQNNGGLGPSNDPRITGRLVIATLAAWRLGGAPGVSANWAQRLDEAIGRIAAWQTPAGLYPSGPLFCDGQYNFMVGLLNDALMKVHASYRADARLATLLTRSVDYQWSTQWLDGARAFKYSSVRCKDGGTEPAGDLTPMMVAPFGWAYRHTGDVRYRIAGERVFAAGVEQAALGGSKQFNQAYTSSWQYLGYR